jgi:hypothetical protein
VQARGVDGAGAYGVHADVALFQVGGPGAREGTDGGFCGALNAIRRETFTGDDGGVEDDGGAVGEQRKGFLHGEEQAFHVDVEDGVEVLFGDFPEGSVGGDASVGEDDVEFAFLLLDLREEAIEIGEAGNVSLNSGYVFSNLLYRGRQLGITAAGYKDVRAFVDKPRGCRQPDAAVTTCDKCNFPRELVHGLPLSERP